MNIDILNIYLIPSTDWWNGLSCWLLLVLIRSFSISWTSTRISQKCAFFCIKLKFCICVCIFLNFVIKVLDYYSLAGIVDVTPLTLPGSQPNLPILQVRTFNCSLTCVWIGNTIAWPPFFRISSWNTICKTNDNMRLWHSMTVFIETCTGGTVEINIYANNSKICLLWVSKYQNESWLFRFKYIVVLDIDEVIVPKKHNSWSSMMEEVLKASAKDPKTISWHFRHTYFIDSMTEDQESKKEKSKDERPKSYIERGKPPLPASNIPEHLHMLNHIFRSVKHSQGT